MRKCAECGADMVSGGVERTINEGTPEERIICEQCFDEMWDKNRITMCNNCGRWFDVDQIHSIGEIGGDTFAPCPFCGHDIVDGESVEDRKTNTSNESASQYVYVVTSSREYENDERYFGCDGAFSSYEQAENYVLNDMRDTLNEESGNEPLLFDQEDFVIETVNHRYRWCIDPVTIQ